MLCRACSFAFKLQFRPIYFLQKNLSERVTQRDDRDPADYFFDDKIQSLMKNLTRIDFEKVFRARKEEQKIETPEYKFMTTEQLHKEMAVIHQKAEKKIQMPPVVKERGEINHILAADKHLQGFTTSKLIFTDITYGVSERERLIVVREPSGVLRQANWEERSRINQIYNDRPGRKIVPPKMFQDEYLKGILKRGEYEFILDRACVQYEPDDPEFIRVRRACYEHINETKAFDSLRSTRHFGPLAFYLAWENRIDDLLIEILNTDRIDEALSLIELYHHLQPKSKSASIDKSIGDIETIRAYAELDSSKRSEIELAVQLYSQRQFHNIGPPEAEAQAN